MVVCAAVMPNMSYGSPLEVGLPWYLRPYQEAPPRSTSGWSVAMGT
jgi:hypothetical protein